MCDLRLLGADCQSTPQIQRHAAARGFGVTAQMPDDLGGGFRVARIAADETPYTAIFGDAAVGPRQSFVLREGHTAPRRMYGTTQHARRRRFLRVRGEAAGKSSQESAYTMLRSAKSLRLNRAEIEMCRRVGLDVEMVRTPADFAAAIDRWIDAVGEVRPDVVERFVRELAKAKGVALPARLSVVPSSGCPD